MNQLIWASLILAAIALMVSLSYTYWYNFIFGPFPFDEATGASVADPETWLRAWVVLDKYPTQDLGVQEASTERIHSRYFSLSVGRRYLVAEVAADFPGGPVATGEIAMMPYPLRDYLASHLFKDDPSLTSRYFSYMVRGGDYRQQGYWALLFGLPALFVAGRKAQKGLRWLRKPESHPVMRQLGRYGAPALVRAEIESEADRNPFRIQDVLVTDRWILQQRSVGLDVSRIADLVWAFGRSGSYAFSVVVRDREGQELSLITNTEENGKKLLGRLQERAPWANFGYDAELDHAWLRDRGAVIQAVVQRAQAGGRSSQ